MSYVFTGNQNMSPEAIERRRQIARELLRVSPGAPQNVGEGLHAIGRALAGRMAMNRADRAEMTAVDPAKLDLEDGQSAAIPRLLLAGGGADTLMGGDGADAIALGQPDAEALADYTGPVSPLRQRAMDRAAGLLPEYDEEAMRRFADMPPAQGAQGAAAAIGGARAPAVDEAQMGREMEALRDDAIYNSAPGKAPQPQYRQGVPMDTMQIRPFSTDEGRAVGTPRSGSGEVIVQDPNSPVGMRSEVIPGSEAEREMLQEQERQALRQNVISAYSDAFFNNLDQARQMVGDTWATTGGLGAILDDVPGTSAHNLSNLLLPVQAGLAFDRLQAMRDMSHTGAALGQVSDRELALLQNSIASLNLSQSEDQLLRNMETVEDAYNRIIHGPPPSGVSPQQWREFHRQNRELTRQGQAPMVMGQSSPQPNSANMPPVPQGLGVTAEEWPMLWESMTPEQRAAFQ